jgi:hypothetical protein
MSPAPRPWLVLVTGEPGSGESMPGRQQGSELRIPLIGRGDVRGGLDGTAGVWTNVE